MVVSYTNNIHNIYAHRENVNPLSTNSDGGGNGGGGAFMKMFEEEQEENKKEKKEISSNPLDDIYNANQSYYTNPNIIKDYIDNSLLLNTEQVACTNITQHIALKKDVKDTLNFLNIQAAKTMVNSKKHTINQSVLAHNTNISNPVKTNNENNFFKTGTGYNKRNFFIQ